jgi:hypothetical protein
MPCPQCGQRVTGKSATAFIGRFGRRERRPETFHTDHVTLYFTANPTQDPNSATVKDGSYYTAIDAEKGL